MAFINIVPREGTANEAGYADAYLKALGNVDGAVYAPDVVADNFQRVFSHLNSPRLAEVVADVYATEFHFNDTLKTLHRRADLIRYLEETGERLEAFDTEILSAFRDGEDIYLRWRMDMTFKAVAKTIHSRTVGMSHLRVNDDGKIILHQDFWDGAAGIYRHLPIIGRLLPGE